jgi:hypothetical protein
MTPSIGTKMQHNINELLQNNTQLNVVMLSVAFKPVTMNVVMFSISLKMQLSVQ